MRHWIVAAALLLTPSAASAGSDQSCLAEAMYFEARDQGWRGMLAVGATSIRPSWSSVLVFRRIIGQHAFYAE